MPLYEVHWVGYDDVTWEPPANLVGAAESVREYDTQEKKESSARKAALIAKTAAKRVADAARLTQEQKERAAKAMREAEEMMAGPTEANPTAPGVADSKPKFLQRTDGRIVLRCHARKQADCYDAYDLSLPIPTCMVNSKGEVGGDGMCGQKVDPKNGTTNFWGHLYRHHRKVWLGLKKKGGSLTQAGEVELGILEAGLQERNQRGSGKDKAEKAPPLSGFAQAVVNRLAGEWVVDEDQFENAAEKPGFKKLAAAISSGAWEGCCAETISQEISVMAVEGQEDAGDFHAELRKDGRKPSMSVDLWSKHHQALLGGLSHGIRRPGNKQPWKMLRKLSACKTCRHDHHTGAFVQDLSWKEWGLSGIDDPVRDIFKAKTDAGQLGSLLLLLRLLLILILILILILQVVT